MLTTEGENILFANPPPAVTLLHRPGKGHPWRVIGTASSYGESLRLGEQAGLKGGMWWFRTRHGEHAQAEQEP
ncbi:MAG: hypothetical protein U0792_00615 [Gemmataceae bacterium]